MRNIVFVCMLSIAPLNSAYSETNCKAVVMVNDDYDGKRGDVVEYLTQYIIDKRSGETFFAQRGGRPFPTQKMVKGKKVDLYHLINCKVNMKGVIDDDSEERIFYFTPLPKSEIYKPAYLSGKIS